MSTHYSPGIAAIHNALGNNRQNRILDLGSTSSGTFNFFSHNSCKIHFENLDAFVVECGHLSTDNLVYQLKRYLLAHKAGEKFDVILSWDLFNYLQLEAVTALLEQLGRHCKPGTLLHSIKYVSEQIPASPRRFAVRDAHSLEMTNSPLGPRSFPRYSTAKLLAGLQHYAVRGSFSEREGMHRGISEQILCYMPDADTRREQLDCPGVSADAYGDSPLRLQSPALAQLLDMLRDSIGVRLLDLGGGNNRAFWLGQGVELVTVDLPAAVAERYRPGGVPVREKIDSLLASCASWRKFDVVVAWDLFNYFTGRELQTLLGRLSACCRGSTWLLAFVYAGREMAAQPQLFQMQPDGSAQVRRSRQLSAPGQAANAAKLLRQLEGFSVKRSFVLREGMLPGQVEYILVPR